jgi:5'-3' exonuclease
MGIPSYFVRVVKEIKHLLKPISSLGKPVHNLYMDCNGIIYDAVRVHNISDFKSTGACTKQDAYESAILQHVCDKISEYVAQVKPVNRVFLTFDGVAPVAKMNQQRERRYRTWFTSEMEKQFELTTVAPATTATTATTAAKPVSIVESEESWSTACITPGTAFMNKLHARMSEYVANKKRESSCSASISYPLYMLSSSKEPGEGEHKIFEFIRANPDTHRDQVTLVYGLDADLIMLALNHLHISNDIYLYRETPEFIQSVDSQLKPNEQYYVDIPYMSDCIARYMTASAKTNLPAVNINTSPICPIVKKHLVYDYIFMFFFMGNDFMPHFPSMNIRTTGPDTVMNAYNATFQNTITADTDSGSKNRSFIHHSTGADPLRIHWTNVREFVQCLAEMEHSRLVAEHTLRDKRGRMFSSGYPCERVTAVVAGDNNHNNKHLHTTGAYDSVSELLLAKCKNATDMLHIPTKERGIEHYIAPQKQGWGQRYYAALFGEQITDRRCQAYCTNYLEGLEWTFQYYTRGCIDWRWRYKYAYAPLLEDLVRFIPVATTATSAPLISHKPKDPIQDTEQLAYVLPPAFQAALIPSSRRDAIVPLKLSDVRFTWAYCKYFWEAHVVI